MMKIQYNSEKIKDQKIVASFFFILALLALLCVLSIPFIENFSGDELSIFKFGVLAVGVGLWFLMNPYWRLKLFDSKNLFKYDNLHYIDEVKKIIKDEDCLRDDIKKSSPKINITFGILIMLFGIALITMAFVSNYY